MKMARHTEECLDWWGMISKDAFKTNAKLALLTHVKAPARRELSGMEVFGVFVLLMAESISHGGELRNFDKPFTVEELAMVIGIDEAWLEKSWQMLSDLGLVTRTEEGTIKLDLPKNFIRKKIDHAWVKAKQRNRANPENGGDVGGVSVAQDGAQANAVAEAGSPKRLGVQHGRVYKTDRSMNVPYRRQDGEAPNPHTPGVAARIAADRMAAEIEAAHPITKKDKGRVLDFIHEVNDSLDEANRTTDEEAEAFWVDLVESGFTNSTGAKVTRGTLGTRFRNWKKFRVNGGKGNGVGKGNAEPFAWPAIPPDTDLEME